ncbi:MAG: hypothetical protein ACK4IY_01370, partial [Chitinophagales bacterium]
HFAEMNTYEYKGTVFNEFISSGLTHSEKPPAGYKNAIDESIQYQDINFGIIELANLQQGEIVLKVIDEKGTAVLQKQIQHIPMATLSN